MSWRWQWVTLLSLAAGKYRRNALLGTGRVINSTQQHGKQYWKYSRHGCFSPIPGFPCATCPGASLLKFDTVRFDHGFYCHATSNIVVQLPSPGKTFTAQVGVDSNSQTRPERGSVVFSVQIGQQQPFRSATVREGTTAVPVTVDLDGATQFVLAVEDGADGFSCDQADWADAQIVLANGETLWLDALPMVCLQRGPFTTEAPFSFQYGDRPSAELLPQWKVDRAMRKLDKQRTEHVVTSDPVQTGRRCVDRLAVSSRRSRFRSRAGISPPREYL